METRWVQWAFVLILFRACFCEEDVFKPEVEERQLKQDDKEKKKGKDKEDEEEEQQLHTTPCEPGEIRSGKPCYYVKLLQLGFSEGTLTKINCDGECKSKHSFDPDHSDYKLSIKSGKSKELLATPMLNVHKYASLLEKPNLFWNGKEEKYSPIQNIEFKLNLDHGADGTYNAGPLERTVTLTVRDPTDPAKGLTNLFGAGHHEFTYKIIVDQTPDIEKIVTATDIQVEGVKADGGTEPVSKKYDPNSKHNEIRYIVGEEVEKVKVQVRCPNEANGLKYNGEDKPKDSWYWSQEFEGATKSILAQCYYKHDKFTDGQEMQRTYVITIARNATVGDTDVDLRMWPPYQALPGQGHCIPKKATKEQRERGMHDGWKCLKPPPAAEFVGSYANEKAELVVRNKRTKGRYRLWNGIPTSIPVAEHKHDDELFLEAGAHRKSFVFLFGPPPQCKNFYWGREVKEEEKTLSTKDQQDGLYGANLWFPSSEWRESQTMTNMSWKCPTISLDAMGAPCKRSSGKTDCVDYPQEVSFANDGYKVTSESYCGWDPCEAPRDIPLCCTPVRQPCRFMPVSKQGCIGDKEFDPTGVARCATFPCTGNKLDKNLCCKSTEGKKAAKCTAMESTCPLFIPGSVVGPAAAVLSCASESCTKHDAFTCCEQRAICTDMVCPPGFSKKYNAALFMCAGVKCDIKDRDTCCDAAAYCSEFPEVCPGPGASKFANKLGWQLKPHAEEIPCGGDPCVEWDTGVCCNKIGYCSTVECRAGSYAVQNAENIPCDGGSAERACVATDETHCCVPAARCHTSYVCPHGYDYKMDSKFVTCPGPVCLPERDRGRCCDMTDPFQAALNPKSSMRLVMIEGGGDCNRLESQSNWLCKAHGDSVKLALKLHWDEMVNNKIVVNTNELITGDEVTIPFKQPITVCGSHRVHLSARALIQGRGVKDFRFTVTVTFPSSCKDDSGSDKSTHVESDSESDSEGDSKEKGDSEGDSEGEEVSTLRKLSESISEADFSDDEVYI